MLSEMLGHLERQPFNKERRDAWLSLIEPVFDAMGLFVVAHFRRLFSLFFQWMHADDDQTVTLVKYNWQFLKAFQCWIFLRLCISLTEGS